MLGHSAIAETSIADVGGLVLDGVAEMSAISTKTSVGVGILGGIAELSGDFTQTSVGTFITSGASTSQSFDFTQSAAANRLDVANIDLTSEFTQTADSIMIRTGVASKDLNFTKTTIGDIKFVVVNASATPETYTTITPSGTETYTEITPSGTETWTEIQ